MFGKIRMRAGAMVVDSFFRGIAAAGKMHPSARPERHKVEVVRDLRYRDGNSEDHLLDVYRPTEAQGRAKPWPIVLYVHGGGFRILSKDSHWVMGLAYARQGYLVFNINYRLAPKHPFPAALEDAAAAYEWVMRNAPGYGGDLSRIVLAGESAGANLVTSLAVASSYRREEAWARTVWGAEARPRAVVAACGILQVSDPARFFRRKKISALVTDRIEEVSSAYLGKSRATAVEKEMADPLVWLEREVKPERELPPFFAPVGTWDPILDDTRRLKVALEKLGVECEARYYEKEVHAFHALVFRKNARRCWRDAYRFLEKHVGG